VSVSRRTLMVVDDEPLFARAVIEDLAGLDLETLQAGT